MRSKALYPVGLSLQRQALADLLRLDDEAIPDVAELARLRILVQQAAADQLLAAVVDEIAKRRRAIAVGAFEIPRSTALTIERDFEDLLVLEEMLVLLAIHGRTRIVEAIAERERLARALLD